METAFEARLVATHGAADDIPLAPGALTLGRGPDNDVVLAGDPAASGTHAELIADERGYAVADLGSTNGTWLNGARLVAYEEYPLDPGDVLVIGSGVYRFEDGAEDDASEE